MAKKTKLKLIPLGGLGEIGKNMTVVEYGRDMFLVDAGLMFPEEEMLGIDLVLPDFSYVTANSDRLRGIVVTHGHEDHVGALPYLLRQVKAPVYATRLTLGLIRAKLAEHNLGNLRLKELVPGKTLHIGCFRVEGMRVNHSIPDGVGLAIHTPVGIVVHSGDFKFDQTPIDGVVTDYAGFSALGDKNVLVLLSDSTNAERPGYTMSERSVGNTLDRIFKSAEKRIVVASFASHVHRVQQVIDAARRYNRKIAVCGRSMENNVAIANELGYLKLPQKMVVPITEINNHPPERIAIVSTGSQGEPLSALTRMAAHDHRFVAIEPGDTVIVSAHPIPGNERAISRTIDRLFQRGAHVFYESVSGVHVSGHALREELKLMISMVKPRHFVPIHGEYRHLAYHAQLAEEMGVARKNIRIAENGDILAFDGKGMHIEGKVQSGVVYVDGLGVGDIGDVVLRDRQQLAQDGILIVVATINQQTGELVGRPEIVSRGFVYMKQATELLEEARVRIEETLGRTAAEGTTDWSVLKLEVKKSISQFLYERTMRRPMILPIVVEV